MTHLERLIQSAEARANRASKGVRSLIDRLAEAAFEKVWRTLVENSDADPAEVIRAAQLEFGGAFAEALAEAFSKLLERAVGTDELRAMPVGDITLARSLYLHRVQTQAEVTALVREHAKGVHQARELSLALYDGYSPEDGIRRPLEGRARAELPKALRSLTEDPSARRTLTALQVQGQQQAARLKTKALRAAYSEALSAWERGAGLEAVQRKLDNAMREKNRFYADRIAQTELQRAHQAQVARELMDDVDTTVVQVRIDPSHPRADICDLHARADLWGLGPGNYPKERAPRPPYHPFCRCRLRSRPSLDARNATRAPMGEAAYLRALGAEQAAQVMGSAERAQRILRGEPLEAVVNEGKARAYRLARVGDVAAQGHPLLEGREFRQPRPDFSPYDPAAPVTIPNTNTPARAAAVALENAIRADPLETGALIAPSGAIIVRRQGAADRVKFSQAELAQALGATFTHNHPGGAGPSPTDVAVASEFGFHELRVVTRDFRHGMSRLPALVQSSWEDEHRDAVQALQAMLVDEVKRGLLHPNDFGVELHHRAWARVAAKLKFTYWRERS